MSVKHNRNWNEEYSEGHKGIPSSHRDTPSSAIVWGMGVLRDELERDFAGLSVVDVGCGAGRNALYLAAQGCDVQAFDGSEVAIQSAQSKSEGSNPRFFYHDLSDGLPFDEGSVDLVTDIFVYKHQVLAAGREKYRTEIKRVLKKGGLLLLSLADREDGYYSQCPVDEDADLENSMTITDPAVQIGSVLFSLEDLKAEFSDDFSLLHFDRKESRSLMHGEMYDRVVLTTLWAPKS